MKIQSNNQQGFTLIEIMVTVAILGILSAIALPSYTVYVKKSQRTDAKVELLRIAQMQESYFVQNLSYAKDLQQLGFPTSTVGTEKGLYKVTMPSNGLLPLACNPTPPTSVACTGYTITAIPYSTKSQSRDKRCRGFMIDNIARKSAFGGSLYAFGTSTAHVDSANECW